MPRRKKHNPYVRGVIAERLAMLWLFLKGYRVRAMRYKTPLGEIDLIMTRGHTLVFVEVKLRRSRLQASASVHAGNQRRVVRAAQYFLQSHPRYAEYTVRFDVCLLAWYRLPYHLPHAFNAQ